MLLIIVQIGSNINLNFWWTRIASDKSLTSWGIHVFVLHIQVVVLSCLGKSPLQTDSRSDYLTAISNLWPFRWCNRICIWFSCLRRWGSSPAPACFVNSSRAQTSSLSTSNHTDTHEWCSGEITLCLKHLCCFLSFCSHRGAEWLYVGFLEV